MEIVAYADDIAVIARASVTSKVGKLLQETAENVVDWLANIGIQLAVEKTHLILPTRRKTYNTLDVTVKGRRITSCLYVKYLGVHIDQKATFKMHTASIDKKADNAVRSLRAIIPNVKGPKQQLLAMVPHPMLLYGAPIWYHRISAVGWRALKRYQRRIELRVACAYRTIFGDALSVLSGIPPIDLLAKEHMGIHERKQAGRNLEEVRAEAKNRLLAGWQER